MQAKKQLISALGNKNEYIKADQLFLLSHRRKTVGDNKVRGDFKSSKQIKYKKQKYSLDKEIKINNKQWRIAEYKFRLEESGHILFNMKMQMVCIKHQNLMKEL